MRKKDDIVDSWLVAEYQSGNRKAASLLVKRWHPKLCKQAYGFVKDMDVAKDVAQESWGVILKKLNSLQDVNKFGSWALTIVTRKAIDWLRKQKKEHQKRRNYDTNIATADDGVDEDTYSARLTKLRNVIRTLPGDQRMVITLFYLEEFGIAEIGEILGVSTGTVKSRLFYAREKLKETLKDRNDEK